MSINIADIVEWSNKIINGSNVNINIYVNSIYIICNNMHNLSNSITVHIPLIKNALEKISEKNIIPEFIKLINLYQHDMENYNKIIIRQYKIDNRILTNNKYYLSEYIFKYINTELLKYILSIHEVLLIIYILKSFHQPNKPLSSNNKKVISDIYIKYFNDLNNDYSLIYLYSFLNENTYNNYLYLNILYEKINNTLSDNENIDIFKKVINTKNYELIQNVILKIKSYYTFNYSLLNTFYGDQKKVDIIIKNFNIPITEDFIILLIRFKYHVDKNTKINNKILEQCSISSFYPYEIDFIPDDNVMKNESKKQNNLKIFKTFHNLGGIITIDHLMNACLIKYNEEMIKYIVESGVKPNEQCLENLKLIYNNNIITNFIDTYLKEEVIKNESLIKLNEKYIFSIEKKNINIDNNFEKKYNINPKILKFFNIENERSIIELKEVFLKYLISNNLIISHYFVIDETLSKLLKNIEKSTIIHINEIENIVSYFIIY